MVQQENNGDGRRGGGGGIETHWCLARTKTIVTTLQQNKNEEKTGRTGETKLNRVYKERGGGGGQ